MPSEAWLDDAYFSRIPSHHIQPVTSATEADILDMILELCTFWSSQAASCMNIRAAECSAQQHCLGAATGMTQKSPEFWDSLGNGTSLPSPS